MSKPTYDLFLSYSSNDLKLAEALHRRLITEGFSVWFDKARLSHGCKWHDEIENGCEASRIVLPILTPSWRKSEWTKFETYGAEAVIPCHYEGAWDEVATPPLMRYQSMTFDCNQPETAHWPKLYKAIRKLLSRPSPEKAARIPHLRYRANPYFVGRETELNKIHEALCRKPTAALTQGAVLAITALGGVGKTTLARQYAEKFWRLYPQMLWVDARIDLVSEFARLADLLIPNVQTIDANEKANEALRILNEKTERLLILDNAEDEKSVQKWIPKTGGCRTIITSRFTAWSPVVEICQIYVLDPEHARELLLRRSNREPDSTEIDAADRLAERLGWLPLALEQAAAFISEQGPDYGFQDYLRLYDEAKKRLLNDGVLGSTEYPDSVITTWKTTIAKLSALGRALLRFSAFLSTEPIPIVMFVSGVKTVLEGEKDFSKPDNVDKQPLDEYYIRTAVKNLSNYSMITSHGNGFSVHGLVQTVERLDIDDRVRQAWWIEKITDLVTGYAPEDAHEPKAWSIWDQLQSHAIQLWEHTQKNSQVDVNVKLPSELSKLYYGKGMYYESIPLAQKVLDIIEERLGADHVDLAYHLGCLGESLRVTNRLTEAEQYFRRALAITTKHYGDNHEDVASDMNYLALALKGLMKTDEAEQLYRKALDIYEKVENPNQHGLFKCLNNLAELLRSKGDDEGAEPLYMRALDICERALGEDHPHTALGLNNLAGLLYAKGDYEGAEPLYMRALDIYERVLGNDHPHTALGLYNLARLLYAKGDYEGAEPLYMRALDIRERVLKKDHPGIAACLNDLAALLNNKGDHEGAEPLYRRSLDICERVLGKDHSDTAVGLNNLALLLKDKGDYEGAEPLQRQSLDIWERLLGEDHPNTVTSLNNLAGLLRSRGDYEGAEPFYRRSLDIRERLLGEDHPDTAFTMHELAFCLDKTDNHSKAEILYKKALGIWEKEYGDDHVEPINCKLNLQICLYQLGSREFDLAELKSCTGWLKDRNDPRANKGLTALRELGKKL